MTDRNDGLEIKTSETSETSDVAETAKRKKAPDASDASNASEISEAGKSHETESVSIPDVPGTPPPGKESAFSGGGDAAADGGGKRSSGPLLSEAEKNIAMCCHLAGLAGLLLPYVGNILGPMIVWAWKKDSSAFVDLQGKSAVNYQICLSMAAFCLLVSGVILSVICIGFLISILSLLLMFAGMFFPIIAALYAREGKQYRYPLSYPFIR